MFDHQTIAVVVPARDEARHIAGVVTGMPAFVDHIVVVDDGSRDDTSAIVRAATRRVDIVCHDQSRGVGAAIVSGYRRALGAGADVVAVMAGDGQMDPADLAGVIAPLLRGEADYVKGNRLRHPAVWRAMPWTRLVGTHLLGRLTSHAIGVPLGDSQCGYTAITRRALGALEDAGALDRLYPSYGYPNDLLSQLALCGQRIAEVTVRPVYRDEQSGLRPWHLVTIGRLIARAAFVRATTTRSFFASGGMG